MTKFQNRSFSVGPKGGEKISDIEWDIAVGLRCPKCRHMLKEHMCVNPNCELSRTDITPDRYCVTDPTGTCVTSDSRCMHNPACWECGGNGFHYIFCAAPWRTEDEMARSIRGDRGTVIGKFDGGSSANPGLGASAWMLDYPDQNRVTGTKRLGITTNNRAEYDGLINLLESALLRGVRHIHVHGDSRLIVEQIKGNWKVKDRELKPLAARVQELIAQFATFEIEWIPREKNAECDALVKRTIKEQQ